MQRWVEPGAQRSHHAVALQALSELTGEDVRELAVYFDSCRVLRNASDHDRAGAVSASDVEELAEEARAFRGRVREWLASAHPRLVRRRGRGRYHRPRPLPSAFAGARAAE